MTFCAKCGIIDVMIGQRQWRYFYLGGEKMIWEDMSYNKLDFPFSLQIEEEINEYKPVEEEEDN